MTTDLLLSPPDVGTAGSTSTLVDAFIEPAAQTAQAFLVLGRIAAARFWTHPATVAAAIAASDPVVSSDGQLVRAESFSGCGGVHGRLDLLPEALADANLGRGSTNVDLTPATRQALTGVVAADPLHLRVTRAGVTFRTLDGAADERRVRLPARWIRGFAEVSSLTSPLVKRFELPIAAARSFLRGLPASTDGKPAWVIRAGSTVRLSRTPTASGVPLAGTKRLRMVEPLLRFATTLEAFGPTDAATGGCSVWVLSLDRSRFSIALSPSNDRGFSGEGSLLADLSQLPSSDLIAEHLGDGPVDPAGLADRSALSREAIDAVLPVLGAQGLLGYDVAARRWFVRELPYVLDERAMNPRLVRARGLAVAALTDGKWEVSGPTSVHRVTRTEIGVLACTCPWWARQADSRGPCAHALAVSLVLG